MRGELDVEADRGMNSDLDHYMRMAALLCRCEAVCVCDDSAWFRDAPREEQAK